MLAHLFVPLLACLLFKDLLDFLLHRFVDEVRRVMRIGRDNVGYGHGWGHKDVCCDQQI